jgi:hypothetical protein
VIQNDYETESHQVAYNQGLRDGINQTKEMMHNQRKSQIELIRLHFAIQWRDTLGAHANTDLVMDAAWTDADSFIKKSEGV